MKKVVFVVAMLMALSVTAAQAANWYFAQDDFTLTFGTMGQPGSANGSFSATGYIKDWTIDSNVAWFSLAGTTSLGAQPVGTQYVTNYDQGTKLTIYASPKPNTTTKLWEGTGWIKTVVNADGSTFASPIRPSYETQPTAFKSLGNGDFMQTFTSAGFSNPEFVVDWLGTYNWGYDNANPADPTQWSSTSTYQSGNVQGKLSAVPEASAVLLGFAGLSTLMGIKRLRK